MATVILVSCSSVGSDDIGVIPDGSKGAAVVGFTLDGSCRYKPFVVISIADDNDEGQAQLLGYSPGDVLVSRSGQLVPERILRTAFIPLGRFRSINGHPCRCPAYVE